MAQRYALGLEYRGSRYLGWQRLGGDAPTLQQALETAIAHVADHPVETVCAGRTDAGVHARCQVVSFASAAPRTARAWMLGITAHLPGDMAVRWCVPVADGFSARFSARARRYRYRILNRPVRPGIGREYLGWERRPLDADRMHRAAQALLGEQDFSAFRSVQCQATHPRRQMQHIRVTRAGEEVHVEVQANAFLHHMVRNIVGSLVPVGRGEKPVEWLAALLAGRDRRKAGPTAAAAGLCFLHPLYPPECGLPEEVTAANLAPVPISEE